MKFSNVLKKFVSINLIIIIILSGIVSSALPKKANAQLIPGESFGVWLLNQALTAAGMAFKAIIMDQIVNDIVNWIQYGDLSDLNTVSLGTRFESLKWADYEERAGVSSMSVFAGEFTRLTNLGFLCSPFGLKLKLGIADIPTFTTEIQCTAEDILANMEDFWSDFSRMRWVKLQKMWEPQNNYYGALILTLDSSKSEQSRETATAMQELVANEGFLGVEVCRDDPSGPGGRTMADTYVPMGQYDESSPPFTGAKFIEHYYVFMGPGKGFLRSDATDPDADYEKWTYPLPCEKKETVTPGKAVSESLSTAINAHVNLNLQGESIGAIIGNYAGTMVNALINRMISEVGKGLKALDTSAEGSQRRFQQEQQRKLLNPCAGLSGDLLRQCQIEASFAELNFFADQNELRRKIEEFTPQQRLLLDFLDQSITERGKTDLWFNEITACIDNQIVDNEGKVTKGTYAADLAIRPVQDMKDPNWEYEQRTVRAAKLVGTVTTALREQKFKEEQLLAKILKDYSVDPADKTRAAWYYGLYAELSSIKITLENMASLRNTYKLQPGPNSTFSNPTILDPHGNELRVGDNLYINEPERWQNQTEITSANIQELQTKFGEGPNSTKENPTVLDLAGQEKKVGDAFIKSLYQAVVEAKTTAEINVLKEKVNAVVNVGRISKTREEAQKAVAGSQDAVFAAQVFYYKKGCPKTYYLEALQTNIEAQLACKAKEKSTADLFEKQAKYESWLHALGSDFPGFSKYRIVTDSSYAAEGGLVDVTPQMVRYVGSQETGGAILHFYPEQTATFQKGETTEGGGVVAAGAETKLLKDFVKALWGTQVLALDEMQWPYSAGNTIEKYAFDTNYFKSTSIVEPMMGLCSYTGYRSGTGLGESKIKHNPYGSQGCIKQNGSEYKPIPSYEETVNIGSTYFSRKSLLSLINEANADKSACGQ